MKEQPFKSVGYVLRWERESKPACYFKDHNLYLGVIYETEELEEAAIFTLDEAENMIQRIKGNKNQWSIWCVKMGRVLDQKNDRWKILLRKKELEEEQQELNDRLLEFEKGQK